MFACQKGSPSWEVIWKEATFDARLEYAKMFNVGVRHEF